MRQSRFPIEPNLDIFEVLLRSQDIVVVQRLENLCPVGRKRRIMGQEEPNPLIRCGQRRQPLGIQLGLQSATDRCLLGQIHGGGTRDAGPSIAIVVKAPLAATDVEYGSVARVRLG